MEGTAVDRTVNNQAPQTADPVAASRHDPIPSRRPLGTRLRRLGRIICDVAFADHYPMAML